MAEITLQNLAHSYDPHPKTQSDYQLKEMNLAWRDGQAYALLGPSGCGKSTLLNIISGLLVPSQGRILFGERDVTELETSERNIAQVFQFPVVYDTMTVYDNLAFPLRNRGADEAYVNQRVLQIAKMIGMDDRLDTRAKGLTADAKQKISLGRGMVREDVSAILFDEPLTVIDPHMKWELRTQLKELHREFGHTMIYVTHDQTEALTFADQVVVMHDGEVVQMGTPQELFDRPAHTFVGYFIGSPGMNVIAAEIDGDTARIGQHTIKLASHYERISGNKVEIGIRPEFGRICDDPDGLPITIERIEDIGREVIIRAAHQGTNINIVAPEGTRLGADENRLVFDQNAISVYADGWIVEGKTA